VERRTRADELRALRVQGLGSGAVVGSALIGYVVPVAIAAVLGFVAGLAVWQATGAYLPILDQTGAVASLPLRPDRQTLIAGGFGAAALIVVAAVIAIVLTRSSKPGARAERTSS
jgi:hypothetical protein